MNKQTRDKVAKIWEELGGIQDALRVIQEDIEAIKDQEQEKYDNLSERAQEGEKGEALSSIIDSLESALGSIEESADSAGTAMDNLTEIVENY
jgi:molecular chaperone GrpE (heat shock protein)